MILEIEVVGNNQITAVFDPKQNINLMGYDRIQIFYFHDDEV
jgi:hypothetical protein